MSARIGSSGMVRAAGRRVVQIALAVGLVLYFAYHLTQFDPARIWLRVPAVDTSIIFDLPRWIFARGDYPARLQAGNTDLLFPYPPPAALVFRALGLCGLRVFIAAWMILMTAGLLITFRSSLAGEDGEMRRAWLALGAASLMLADSPVSWDLRSGNSNLVYLGVVFAAYGLLRRRPGLSGALLGLSISLKLYSVLLLLWLWVNGPKRALHAAGIAIAVLWLMLPVALFGLHGTLKLYAGWREQLRIINGLWVYREMATARYGPPLITLRRAVVILTGRGPDAATTRSLVILLWAVWLAALSWYARRALVGGRVAAPSRAALADWIILLLAPLPFSPWIEPYHTVAIVPGTILCLVFALDWRLENQARIIAAVGALLVFLSIHIIGVPLPIRGLGVLAQLLSLTIVFGLLRPRVERLPLSENVLSHSQDGLPHSMNQREMVPEP